MNRDFDFQSGGVGRPSPALPSVGCRCPGCVAARRVSFPPVPAPPRASAVARLGGGVMVAAALFLFGLFCWLLAAGLRG